MSQNFRLLLGSFMMLLRHTAVFVRGNQSEQGWFKGRDQNLKTTSFRAKMRRCTEFQYKINKEKIQFT